MTSFLNRPLTILAGIMLLSGAFFSSPVIAADRNVLWDIVSNCLDPSVADYGQRCQWPLEGSEAACRKTTAVWGVNRDFVALRDRKMCNCPDNREFVHGLAIPRSRVTGTEDPGRPAAIWQFAWDQARSRIADEEAIALAVNPPGEASRTQDQLHLHLVRLNEAGRQLRAAARDARVDSLDKVWEKAAELALGRYSRYGVLVAKRPGGGFLVHVEDRNLEHAYTVYRCPE